MEKKKYEKPVIEIVEIRLSECIAGSVQTDVTIVKGTTMEKSKVVDSSNSSWDSSF